MDKSAKTITGLALGCFCFAIVWTVLGDERPDPVIPTKAPAQKPEPVLAPPPKNEPTLVAFPADFLEFSPELVRVSRDLNSSVWMEARYGLIEKNETSSL